LTLAIKKKQKPAVKKIDLKNNAKFGAMIIGGKTSSEIPSINDSFLPRFQRGLA
jgi:hypothetical protein